MIKLKILKWGDYPGFTRLALKALVCILTRGEEGKLTVDRDRGKGYVRTAERNLKMLSFK